MSKTAMPRLVDVKHKHYQVKIIIIIIIIIACTL
jgi:hypothetical protein